MALSASERESTTPIRTLNFDADGLDIEWADGGRDRFCAIWLRDNAQDATSRDPRNGQRLFAITELPPHVALADAGLDGAGRVALRFAPDGHETAFDPAWLAAHGHGPRRATPDPVLWGAELADGAAAPAYEALRADPAALLAWLRRVESHGVAFLRGVPAEPGRVLEVVGLFGHVHETNYGRLFDVRAEPQPINLAYTGLGLSVHTDNPYRDPVPTLQLLHCLDSEADGGDSVVVDGFHAADILRREAPDDFARLCRHAVPFRFESGDAVLEARAPLIELDDRDAVRAVRFNNRSAAPFDLPADIMPGYYAAYRRFAEILQRPELEATFKLGPGELFMVDNRRVLHGRKAFAGGGRRHLQGCYAHIDGLHSTARVLERQLQGNL